MIKRQLKAPLKELSLIGYTRLGNAAGRRPCKRHFQLKPDHIRIEWFLT